MNKDIVILLLEYAKKHINTGFFEKDFTDYLLAKNTYDPIDIKFVVGEYTEKYFIEDDETGKIILNPEGYFAYLQYLDMQFAIQSQELSMAAAQKSIGLSEESIKLAQESIKKADKSIKIAIGSIILSFVTGLFSLGFSIWSHYDDRTIVVQDTQIRELIQVTAQVKKNNENLILLLEDIGVDIKKVLAENDSIN